MSVSDLEQCGCLQWFRWEGVLWLSKAGKSVLLCVLEFSQLVPQCFYAIHGRFPIYGVTVGFPAVASAHLASAEKRCAD